MEKPANHALISAIGTDRVGIVDDIAREILERSCNIEESRMTLLGGDFAVLMLVSGDAEAIRRLLADAPSFAKSLGLTVTAKSGAAPASVEGALPYILESASLDTPGIVRSVASVLRRSGINIADLETATESAPWTGAPMFIMRARLLVPRTVSIAALRRELQILENEYNLDLRLKSAIASSGEA